MFLIAVSACHVSSGRSGPVSLKERRGPQQQQRNGHQHHRLPRPYLDNPNSAYRLSRRGARRPALGTPSSEEGDGGSPNRPRSSQSSTSAGIFER